MMQRGNRFEMSTPSGRLSKYGFEFLAIGIETRYCEQMVTPRHYEPERMIAGFYNGIINSFCVYPLFKYVVVEKYANNQPKMMV